MSGIEFVKCFGKIVGQIFVPVENCIELIADGFEVFQNPFKGFLGVWFHCCSPFSLGFYFEKGVLVTREEKHIVFGEEDEDLSLFAEVEFLVVVFAFVDVEVFHILDGETFCFGLFGHYYGHHVGVLLSV